MNDRFPVLSKISRVTKTVGWILIGVGCVAAFVGFVGAMGGIKGQEVQGMFGMTDHRGGMSQTTGGIVLFGGGFGAIAGLMLVIFAEVVGVLFAIEGNTRESSKFFGGAPGGRLPDGDDSGER